MEVSLAHARWESVRSRPLEDPERLFVANNYAVTLLESAGDPTGALELLEEVLKVRRRILGNEHPETLDSITNLALNYMEVGRYEAALPLSEEAVALTRGTLAGPDRVEGTAHAIGSLAAVLHLMGEPSRARQLHEEALQMRRRLLGPSHLDTMNSEHGLGQCLISVGESTAGLAMLEDVVARARTRKEEILGHLEWVYLLIFTFELVTKMLAYGLIVHKHSYLRDPWCQLDFVVVSLAWLPILFPAIFGNMSAIRSVRALRPLRALKRVPGMPVLVGSILKSMPAMGNVAGLAGFILLVFGIVGMNLFKGVLHYRCADPAMLEDYPDIQVLTAGDEAAADEALDERRRLTALKGGREEFISSHPQADYDSGTLCYADARICAEVGQICVYFDANPDGDTVSFDSVSRAMLPILQAITFDTWTDPMFYVMDAYSFAAWGYFIAIAILGGMFVVNLFLAVIFDEFMRAQATEEAVEDLTSGATEGGAPLDSARGEADDLTLLPMPHSPGGETGSKHCCTRLDGGDCCDCSPASDEGCCGWRYTLRQAMLSSTLGNISTFFVVFNLFLMCLPYAGQSKAYENDVEMASSVVTWIFIIEMFLKLLSMGCSEYWGDSWNVLDGIIVSISIVEIVITVLLADTGVNISFLRMLRLLRLLRLLKAWPGLYKIVMSFVKAIPQISNLCVLLFILMFIFALLGMQTFGGTAISEDSRWHFDYFYPAILTVFNIFTGGWVDAFQACSDEMGVLISTLYFVPALIIGFFIIMNLFVAILLEAFAGDEEEEGGDEGGDDEKKLELDVATGAEAETEVELIGPEPLEGVSLFCLGPANGFRQGCRWIAEHSIFDQFIILLIIASSVCLAIDVPRLDPDSELKAQLDRLNLIFTALFVLEMMLKIVAYGFLFTPKAYLKQGWNILDFFIVMISILGLLADIVPVFGKLKCLRILRVLRPLRLLARHPGMKILITSLIKTLPSVVEVFAVVFVFHVVFAIMGMQMFVGRFGACTDESIKVRAECYEPGSKHDPAVLAGATARLEKMRMLEDAELPTEWINPPYGSFDDWGQSMIILYIAATGDGWEAFMFAGMDATGVDMAPERNDFSAVAVFFLMWMLVGNFVSINLFVGSIVDNFTRIKKEDDGSATMTPEQTQWVNTIKGSSSEYANKAARKPRCDCCGLRNRAFELVNSRAFEFFVMGVILTNTFGMTLDFWRVEEHPKYDEYYDGTMMCFTYFYYAEFLIKFFALGCHYFADGWCRFDFFLVSISAVDQFAPLLLTVLPVPPTMLRVLRVMRVLRVLRLVKELKGLRDLVMTLVISVPALFNVGCLLGLVMFMYAVLGLNVFTYVQHSGAISADRNFESFGNAMLLLFQCLTGDGWSEIMDDSMITEERGCDPHPADGSPSDCGSKLALPYFMSFTVIGTFVMLNLVVAVILENFTSLGSVNPNLVSPDDIQDFKALWATFDPDANGLIPAKFLPALVKQLKPPIGIMGTPDGATNAKALRFCLSLGLTQSNGEVNFKIVLDALINKNYKAQNVDIEEDVKTAKSPAVIEALELRRQYSEIPLSAVSAGRLKNSLTPRRRELSKVFAEEILRMFIRRKRKAWLKNPKSHPSYRGPGASPKKGKSVVLSEKPAPAYFVEYNLWF
ncbi:sodium channel protein type 9 subunit alpha [Chrysochromulina tobinii]|uniref:Calcium-channel protein CCH1 n=1 Tax=Chrysochromulina tobinii TaxID=1460289 RepID=A0A0M0K1M8_9EUKA|nr:sodium channel protein type 9 subunit alpha [Chrysochromulina tobinii]|eukprot:KOO32786.1 sodium channel protein type 9 subunit alpha [Chrysochromulina sp. CCMP291]